MFSTPYYSMSFSFLFLLINHPSGWAGLLSDEIHIVEKGALEDIIERRQRRARVMDQLA